MSENQSGTPSQYSEQEKRYRSFPMLTLIVINYCLGFFYFGYNLAYLGTFRPDNIITIFQITIDQSTAIGLVMGCLPVGAAIGSLLSALLMKVFSRRNSLLFVNVLAIIIVGVSMVPNFGVLFFCRIMQGMFVGFYTAQISLIIYEIVPTEVSGSFGAFSQLFVNVGVFVSFLIQFLITEFNSQVDLWRVLFAFMALPILIQTVLLIFVFNFQTPKYLLQQQRQEDCRKLLKYLYKQQFVQEVLVEKKKDLGMPVEVKPPKTTTIFFLKHHMDMAENNNSEADTNKKQIQIKEDEKQKSSKHKKGLRNFIAIELSILQQFSGINAFAAYGVLIILQIFPDYANLIPMLLNLLPIFTGLMTTCLLTKVGRKPILQFGTGFIILALILTAIGYFLWDPQNVSDATKALILIGFFIFMAMFGLSVGPLVFLLVAETVSPQFISIATLVNWSVAALVSILFPILSEAFGSSGPIFTFFAIWCILTLVFNQKMLFETDKKTEKQIYEQYDEVQWCC